MKKKTYVKPPHFKTISFQMLKGGVAKTTSALNVGLRAAQWGARVLMIDVDQQANLTYSLGVDAEEKLSFIDVVEKKVDLQQVILPLSENLDLLPSNLNNSVLDRALLNSHRNWANVLKTPLQTVSNDYDLILIDTAPSLSMMNTAVTCASDLVVLPVAPDRFSYLGAQKHLQDLAELKADFDLEFATKILFTRFDAREKASHQLLDLCQQTFGTQLMKSYVRTSSELKNAIGSAKNIFATPNKAQEDYDLVTRELLGLRGSRYAHH